MLRTLALDDDITDMALVSVVSTWLPALPLALTVVAVFTLPVSRSLPVVLGSGTVTLALGPLGGFGEAALTVLLPFDL